MPGKDLFKGNLTTIILKLLKDSDKMYGYEITQEVKKITQGKLSITEGALYPALHKLEAAGVLDVEVLKVDNRLRKYYRLTEKGNRETTQKLAELKEYIKTLESIICPNPIPG